MSRGSMVIAFLAICLSAPGAVAHRFRHPKQLRVRFEAERVIVAASLRLDAGGPSIRTRVAFDRDTDGRLDGQEQRALQAFLLRKSEAGLRLTIGGRPAPLRATRLALVHADRRVDDSRALEVAALYVVPLPPSARLQVELRHDAGRGRHVPVNVELAEGWTLARAVLGRRRLGPGELRTVSIRVDRPLSLTLRQTSR